MSFIPRPGAFVIVPARFRSGGVAERLKAHAWKACIRETVSRVRIPLPPPASLVFARKNSTPSSDSSHHRLNRHGEQPLGRAEDLAETEMTIRDCADACAQNWQRSGT